MSHKSPSAQRWWAKQKLNADARKLAKSATGLKESHGYAIAFLKHPKAGRLLSNASSRASITGWMRGEKFDIRKLTRQTDTVFGPVTPKTSQAQLPHESQRQIDVREFGTRLYT